MSTDTAYKSQQSAVIEEWREYQSLSKQVAEARAALSESVGRNLMVNRSGFGHGTCVVGFEKFSSDEPGTTFLDGSLRVMKNTDTVQPNLRTKRGKDMQAQLRRLDSPRLDLPGMPGFHIGGSSSGLGLSVMVPALWEHESVLYALWPHDGVPVDPAYWTRIPLSVYYTAKEQHDGE